MVRNFPKSESDNKAPNKGAVYANRIKPWYNAEAVFSANPRPSAKYKANIAKLKQKCCMCKKVLLNQIPFMLLFFTSHSIV